MEIEYICWMLISEKFNLVQRKIIKLIILNTVKVIGM